MGGTIARGLVDTGCTTTLVSSQLVADCKGESYISAFDGREVKCRGTCWVNLVVAGIPLNVKVVVTDSMIGEIDLVLGNDVIDRLGGVTVKSGKVQFGAKCLMAALPAQPDVNNGPRDGVRLLRHEESKACLIEDKDFRAEFDGKQWTVEWYWKNNTPVELKNKISCYDRHLDGRTREEFEKEVDRWVEEGILVPWEDDVDSGILPLMAVEQPTKNKVRPVLDFRELNKHVECHTGDDVTDVCSETLREWRRMNEGATIVDLKSAYLQIRVAKKLWQYQLVKYKGKTYCLTRLGFGLNSAPRIMAKILKTVLGKREAIKNATSSYIDDILVDETEVPAMELSEYLGDFGLVTKPPEPLEGGAALGLRLDRVGGELLFHRGNKIPDIGDSLTRRELFSVCGKLVGHYPVAGWLRVASSYVKRRAEGSHWEDQVGENAVSMIKDVIERVKKDDPVRGSWYVKETTRGVVWSDASSLALGVLLEVNNSVVEDAAWLRKKDDCNHINVAELEAALKGINLALKWGLRTIEIKTDSVTVHGWMKSVITEERRLRTKGAAEMIVKRRLGILRDLINEFGLKLSVTIVPTAKNKADALTRVKKVWLTSETDNGEKGDACCAGVVNLTEMHNMHHMGLDRTLYLARKIDPTVSRQSVKRIVRCCERCQSIDPAPTVHEMGEVSVGDNWKRLAIDVTHYRQLPYLSIVDCGPSRIAIWRELRRETAEEIATALESIFFERGPVDEVLMDNSTAFRSELLERMLDKWNVRRFFRAAYRPGGNGIVERHHRTIKALAERGNISPIQAVFWYNLTPRSGLDENSVPQRSVFRYEWRHPVSVPEFVDVDSAPVKLGDEVWVKPPNARCTTKWRKGDITNINSSNNVSVDGMPRHVLDIRRIVQQVSSSEESSENEQQDESDGTELVLSPGRVRHRYPQRERRPPEWTADYEMGDDF